MRKTRTKLWGLLTLAVLAVVAAAAFWPARAPVRVQAAESSFTLNGSKHAITVVDPWSISEGESSWGVLKINEFNTDVSALTGGIVYTTKWLYPETPVRAGAYEYAFEYRGGRYVLSEKHAGGNTYIPVNGLVISLMSRDDAWESAAVGAALTKTVVFPDYAGAVEIVGTGSDPKVADKTVRIAIDKVNGRRDENQAVYYNNEWGAKSNQNEFGAEIKCSLQPDGNFKIAEVRNVRDTAMATIGAKDFVLSVHGPRRILLANELVARRGDTVRLVGMKFVDLNKSASTRLTAKNPVKPVKDTDLDDLNDNLPFPGYRAENYLMYYDADYDKSGNPASAKFANFTGCNEWGYEILVRKTSGAGYPIEGIIEDNARQIDSLLSDGESFILSGNGAAETFLTANALNGARVVIAENGAVTITTTPDSYVTTALARYELVNGKVRAALDAKYKLAPEAEALWGEYRTQVDAIVGDAADSTEERTLYGYSKKIAAQEAAEIVDNVTLADFYGSYLDVLTLCYRIESLSYQAPAVTSIAAWHRPVVGKETSVAGIRETLELFRKVNFNTVYVETLWNGYSMTDNSAYVDYHINFKDCDYAPYDDYLSAFIGEAHALGIEVHAWVENFFVGYEGYEESNILTGQLPNSDAPAADAAERASWVIRDYQGNEYTQFEGGKYKFIDPANPAVRDFFKGYYEELLTEYDLDGINLDYIRYPVQNGYGYNKDNPNVPYDHGYSEYAAGKFLAEQGYAENNRTLARLKRDLNKGTSFTWQQLYGAWTQFKIRQVNEFVEEVYELVGTVEAARRTAPAGTYANANVIVSTAVFPDADVVTKKCQDWSHWFEQGWIEVATPMAYYTNANTVTQKIRAMIDRLDNISYNYGGIAPYFMGLNPYQEVVQAAAATAGGAFGTVIFDSKTILHSPEAVAYLSSGIYSGKAITPHQRIDRLLGAFAEEMKSRKALYEITGEKAAAYDAALDALAAMPYATPAEVQEIRRAVYRLQSGARQYASGHAVTRIAEEAANLNAVLDVQLSRLYIDRGEWIPADGLRPDQLNPITGVTAADVTVTAGETGQIALTGTQAGDVVSYRTTPDGAWTADNPAFTEEGVYVVYYRVEREGFLACEGSATVTVKAAGKAGGCAGCNGALTGTALGVGVAALAAAGAMLLLRRKKRDRNGQ